MKPPKTQYTRSGDFSIAYQVVGDGPLDVVHIPGLVSHLDHAWTHPKYVRFMRQLSSFARVIVYDKRGTGLSDPFIEPPSVEERIDDEREWWGGFERTAISRRVLIPMTAANIDLDIRAILPTIRVPTLLLHRTGDMNPIEGARYMAERIPGARLIEMEGDDHWPWIID